MQKIMIAGTFRSGTNLTQHCLKTFFETKPLFNRWFWKHGVPPTGIQRPIPPEVPVIVMTKDPVALNVSLYKFWLDRRPELDVGKSLSEFIRRRFIVYDNSRGSVSPKYYYATPTEYWNQFYFSWLNWTEISGRRVFLKVEDMMADPDRSLTEIADQLGLKKSGSGPVKLPEKRIGPTPPPEIRALDHSLFDEDIVFIRNAVDPEIADALRYTSD